MAPLGLRFAQDRRNQALSPTRGHSVIMDLEHAAGWTGSDFRYTRILTEGSWYTQGRSRWVFAARLRGGWVNPGGFKGFATPEASGEIVPPEKRLYAGGSNSVRGFAPGHLGPRVLYLREVKRALNPIGGSGSPPCTPQEVMDLSCDAGALPDDAFAPRPTGGTSLLEGSVEFRFPVLGQVWEGATFLDFGQVWEEDLGVDLTGLEFTPGLGIRYFSPIGPIRVDLAYRFAPGDALQVVTPQIREYVEGDKEDKIPLPEGEPDYVLSGGLALLSHKVLWGEVGPWSIRRFQLHISIGQAF